LDNGKKKEVSTVKSVTGDTVELNDALTETYLEGHKLRVIEAEVSARQEGPNGELLKQEDFVNLQLKDNKDLGFLVTTIKTLSSLLAAPTLGAGFPDDAGLKDFANFPIAANGTWARLENGADNIELLSVDDFVGEDKGKGNRTGIQAFEDIDEISICLTPCIWSPVVHAGLIQHCEALKDRFAILDPKDNLSIEEIREFREPYDTNTRRFITRGWKCATRSPSATWRSLRRHISPESMRELTSNEACTRRLPMRWFAALPRSPR